MQLIKVLGYVVIFIAVAALMASMLSGTVLAAAGGTGQVKVDSSSMPLPLKVVASQFLNSKNEPHDVTWDTCLNGGEIKDRPDKRGQSPKAFMADQFTLFLEDLPPLYR